MATVKVKDIPKYLLLNMKLSMGNKRGKVPFLHGGMGIGKSQQGEFAAELMAKYLGKTKVDGLSKNQDEYGFVDHRLSMDGPEDIKGFPMKGEGANKKRVQWLDPDFWPDEGTYGCIFFDEANLGEDSTLKAAYQIINDRRLGNRKLPDGWTIIAAGNGVNEGILKKMFPALKNRFCHFHVEIPTTEEMVTYAIENKWNMDIVTYWQFKNNPKVIYGYDPNLKDDAFPTPRTWEHVNDTIKVCDEDMMQTAIGSWIGEGLAIEFMAHRAMSKKIDLKAIMKNPESIKKIKDNGLMYSIIGGLAEEYRKDHKTAETLMEIATHIEEDMAVVMVKFMKDIRATAVKDIGATKAFNDVLFNKLGKYF